MGYTSVIMTTFDNSTFSQGDTFSSEQIAAIQQGVRTYDGGERIFASLKYFVGGRYVSPFRSEAEHENLSIYRTNDGIVRFNDFAGDAQGDWFRFLKELKKFTDTEAVSYTIQCYGIEFQEDGSITISSAQQQIPVNEESKPSSTAGHSVNGSPQRQQQKKESWFSDIRTGVVVQFFWTVM